MSRRLRPILPAGALPDIYVPAHVPTLSQTLIRDITRACDPCRKRKSFFLFRTSRFELTHSQSGVGFKLSSGRILIEHTGDGLQYNDRICSTCRRLKKECAYTDEFARSATVSEECVAKAPQFLGPDLTCSYVAALEDRVKKAEDLLIRVSDINYLLSVFDH